MITLLFSIVALNEKATSELTVSAFPMPRIPKAINNAETPAKKNIELLLFKLDVVSNRDTFYCLAVRRSPVSQDCHTGGVSKSDSQPFYNDFSWF